MAPAEVAVRRGLPARKRRNSRRAIVLRFETSGTWGVIRVMGTSIVVPTDPHGRSRLLSLWTIWSLSSSFQRFQVGDDILAIVSIGNADDHLGPMNIGRRIG